ncbi:DUF2933 domain-containing protein [Brevibacillus agri]|uniref:DUF2933 domain-containing protein n=1 Tax=Brevibacillus gelatini TaxID=1655277 RepID=A0A3M8B3L2_9BACL|nr:MULTISPECIES: DUF2933 domain-containing protein [Brevibacillus]MED4569583.1 DUF2933 domain-containing protein [Brevibacillus agri]RNB57920.1 DUF2933 domain-containing protein [Brevibacillus gelatini]
MEWLSILTLLACPLMMLICMKGMNHNHKGHVSSIKTDDPINVNELQMQIKELTEKNQRLYQEVQALKGQKTEISATSSDIRGEGNESVFVQIKHHGQNF